MEEAVKEMIFMKNHLIEITGVSKIDECILLCDNQSAIKLAKNSGLSNSHTKHINIKYHFIRSLVLEKVFRLMYIESKENISDGLTQILNGVAHKKFVQRIL